MSSLKLLSVLVVAAVLSGCASTSIQGPQGPRIVTSGHANGSGQYAEVGLQFSTPGDFVALFSFPRWKSPVDTGGCLSWVNPLAWKEDGARTGRILFGQAVLVGGAVAVASADVDIDSSSSDPVVSPPPPSGGGGGVPPPSPR
jgi:hypothetical protein